MNKKLKSLLALLMGVVMSTSIVACGDSSDSSNTGSNNSQSSDNVEPYEYKQGTYRTTTAVMPSNWNEFTYADNNDTQILSYISSSFFDYDYEFDGEKYNADGSINKDAIVAGSYSTNYSAATKLEDVTSTVDAKWGYTDAQKEEGGYAWKITLRNDLKWDNGEKIDADDFVYSMKEILNPDFLNMRANTYYDTLRIKKSKAYFNKNQDATYPTTGSQGYATQQEAIDAGETLYIDTYFCWGAEGYVDAEGNECPQWLPITDETIYDTPDAWTAGEAVDAFNAAFLWNYYQVQNGLLEVGGQYESAVSIKVENAEKDVTWEQVGMYKVDELSFVVCLDKAYQFLKDDGSLSYLAAYYMSSLPLVKEDLYESCKIAPAEGSTLWTSDYNTTKEKTASWGPYKLVDFQSGKFYKLEKSENWYGYAMEEYKNQYNVTAIECECVAETATQWMKFLGGETDDAGLDSDHVKDYMYSKYVNWTPGSGTYGMQLFGDKDVLAASENNNAILAIDEFRQGFSLALNRADVVETIWPGSAVACFGLLNPQYFYDVENGGVYRYTEQAMEGLLRAYGFEQDENGKWGNGTITNASLEDAYDALTGYNPALAKEKMQAAYDKLVADESYNYDSSKKITLVYGSSQDTPKQRDRAKYLQGVLDAVCAGTDLEGKIEIVFDASAGNGWADAFRAGDTQIGFGYGFSGNPFNPFDIIGAFVDPDDSLNYHTYWDTTKVEMTLTMPEGDYEGAGETITMSLCNWFKCLNGLAADQSKKYNWDAGYAPAEARLTVLAALEEQVIKKSHSVMLIGDYSGSLLSAKFSQFDEEYNTFMGHGGIRYMVVNYTDAEWNEYVKANGNDLTAEYKKSE